MEERINNNRICLSLLLVWALLFGWIASMKAQESNPPTRLEIDRDTTNSQLNIGTIGDVISGYDNKMVDACDPDSVHPYAFRWYHVDILGNPVRQIVVLNERWDNLPEDLQYWYEEDAKGTPYSGLAGFRLAALTPKEYAEAKYHNEIWGEVFEMTWAEGITNENRDTMPNYPGMEIVCYSDSIPLGEIPTGWTKHRQYSREIMTYTDSTTMKDYMCAAPNTGSYGAEYTPGKSYGRYNCRWMLLSDEELEVWWKKYIDYIKGQQVITRFKFI